MEYFLYLYYKKRVFFKKSFIFFKKISLFYQFLDMIAFK